jgi:hypothetical protein
MKKLSLIALSAFIYLSSALPVFAQNVNPCPTSGGGNFNLLCNIGRGDLAPFIQQVITFLFIIATIIATFFLIYGGIKWITSGGDKAGVENARNIILAAVIGLIITFLTYFILNLVMSIFGLDDVGQYTIPTLELN